MESLTISEKNALDKLKEAIPKLNDEQKERLLIFSEAVALIAESNAAKQNNKPIPLTARPQALHHKRAKRANQRYRNLHH